MLLPKLGGFWLLPPRDSSHHFLSESHPMDHDSDSSGHANTQARPQLRSSSSRLLKKMESACVGERRFLDL